MWMSKMRHWITGEIYLKWGSKDAMCIREKILRGNDIITKASMEKLAVTL